MLVNFSLAIIVILSLVTLRERVRLGQLLSPVSGLHLLVLLMFGVPGFLYFNGSSVDTRLLDIEVAERMGQTIPLLAVGYLISVLIEWKRNKSPKRSEPILANRTGLNSIFLALFLVSFAGKTFPWLVSISAIGTLVTFCDTFFFPTILVSLLKLKNCKTRWETFSLIIVILLGFYLALNTFWRSTFILLVVTASIAIFLRYRKALVPLAIAGLVFGLIFVPFQNRKKVDFVDFEEDRISFFIQSQQIEFSDRIEVVSRFYLQRANYCRELVFVHRAIDSGFEYEYGGSYGRALLNLVPRFLWKDKPMNNVRGNYDIPRDIGIISFSDDETRWAVNSVAEVTYNYGITSLLIFVPLLFKFARMLEEVSQKFIKNRFLCTVVMINFFYLFLQHTSVVFFITNIIGILFIAKLVEKYDEYSESIRY